MLLKNNSKRLITINGALVNGQRIKAYQIKCGLNNSASVPDALCDNAFVKALIERGDLTATEEVEEVETTDSDYTEMNKDDLTDYAEALGIDVKSAWTKAEIIEAIEAEEK